jgi:Mg2+/Co2+ transporter CorB
MIFASDYTTIYLIGFVILTLLMLVFAEIINSAIARFVGGVLLLALGLLIFHISALMGGVLIGIAILLDVRSFLWK